MIDYNVRDDWPAGEPRWMKSLVSSLYRRHGATTVLPLTASVTEILDWVSLASGEDAWRKAANRKSLSADLDQSAVALGPNTRAHLARPIALFQSALSSLDLSKKDGAGSVILAQAPGMRTDAAWTDVETTGRALLAALIADDAVAACWGDLVEVARKTTLDHREYRPIADLLYDQLRLRRLEPESVLSSVKEMLAYGRGPSDEPSEEKSLPAEERLTRARSIVLEPAEDEPVVVWLGYLGGRIDFSVEAGNVTFMQAAWFVPNAQPGRPDFKHKEELSKIVEIGLFRFPELIEEQPDADLLVRVDLGRTSPAGAALRAENIVGALLNAIIHWSNGVRPELAQTVVLLDGEVSGMSMQATGSVPIADDYYGLNITAEAIRSLAPDLGNALSTGQLPVYLSAALEAQTAADLPYSRERMLQPARDADVRAAIPLEDRVVQHVAAHAALPPADLFALLLRRWPASRWESDVDRAVRWCLLGSGPQADKVRELQRKLYSTTSKTPWLVFVADNEADLLNVCRIESERAWITRLIHSVSDPTSYAQLIHDYELERDVLADRRTRVRNALVHGNPVGSHVVDSVSSMASYLSRYALRVGLDSFVTGQDVQVILDRELQESASLLAGTSAADLWRAKAATP